MHHAMAIAQQPRDSWGPATDTLPTVCPHADCTDARGCRERVRDYLRIQYRMQACRDSKRGRPVRP